MVQGRVRGACSFKLLLLMLVDGCDMIILRTRITWPGRWCREKEMMKFNEKNW